MNFLFVRHEILLLNSSRLPIFAADYEYFSRIKKEKKIESRISRRFRQYVFIYDIAVGLNSGYFLMVTGVTNYCVKKGTTRITHRYTHTCIHIYLQVLYIYTCIILCSP